MSFKDKTDAVSAAGEEMTPELDLALREFRLSVHTWSEDAYSRPRTADAAARRKQVWRLAAGWALSVVLIAGGVSTGFWEHHRQEMRMAAARVAEHERLAAKLRNQQLRPEDEDLLAKVDSDVSREVPSAMEPLAQMMAEDTTR
ncbi:MAG: hypothetical protein ACLQGT_09460 [Terracidiphilus sp.]